MISVIIPIYNTGKYLVECIESVQRQTYSDIEILLMDDGSTDESVKICREYEEADPRVHLTQLNHGGVSVARNIGIEAARGEYVYFLDSDDWVEPGVFEELFRKMERCNAGIGVTYTRWFGSQVRTNYPSRDQGRVEYLSGDEAQKCYGGAYAHGLHAIGGKMIRASLIGDVRFREDLPSGEDTLFMYQLIQKKPLVVMAEGGFYMYRMHGANAVQSNDIQRFESVMYVYKHIAESEYASGRGEAGDRMMSLAKYSLETWMRRSAGCPTNKELRRRVISEILRMRKVSDKTRTRRMVVAKSLCFILSGRLYMNFFHRDSADTHCSGCMACVDICPKGCISVRTGMDGFKYPVKDKSKCSNCGLCDKVCPGKENCVVSGDNRYYAFQAKDNDIRKWSTSGGAFRILAEFVIQSGGVVVGAAMIESKIRHVVVESMDELSELSGSKYVQSDTCGIYRRVKELLDQGRQVLFSGTGCQGEALRRFLNRDYTNLIVVDLICNGVGSPHVWDKYVRYLEKNYGSKLLSYRFRDKRNADDGHTIAACFESGEQTWSMYKDPFCMSYFRGLVTRPHCGNCLYCTENRKSDITLGDFWGIESILPEWHDGYGTSLVIVHSDKGERIIRQCADKVNLRPCQWKDTLQPRLMGPTGQTISTGGAAHMLHILPFRLWLRRYGK